MQADLGVGRGLTRTHLMLLAVVIVLLGSQFLVQWQLTEKNDDVRVINLAGRQRMLSQRLTKAAFLITASDDSATTARARAELSDSLTTWRDTQLALRQGSDELQLSGDISPEIARLFVQIDPAFQAMGTAADCLLLPVQACDQAAAVTTMLNHEAEFLTGMDAIVRQYEDETYDSLNAVRQSMVIRTVLTLLLILVVGYFVLLPASRRMLFAVNDLRATQQALRQSEARLRSMLDSQTAYVVRTDMRGEITFVNQAWLKDFGWMPEACVGSSSMNSILSEDRDKTRETVKNCLQNPGEVFQITLRKPTQEGGFMWSVWDFTAITSGSGMPTEIQCVGVDVTTTVEMQAALLESEMRFSTAFMTSPVPMAITTPNAQQPLFVEVNDTYCALVGFSREELVGQGVIELGIAIPGEGRDARQRTLETVGHYASQPGQIRTRTGELHDVIISAQRNMIAGKQYDSTIVLDVTEQKRSEALAQEIKRLTAGVKKEQQHYALVQQTLSKLSHDLGTPLTMISTAKDTLDRYFDKMTLDKRHEKLESIGRQVQFIQELLRDLTLVVKGNLKEREFNPRQIDLAALCQLNVDEICAAHPDGARLRFVNRVGDISAQVDETLISRILLNLLTNALKYSPDGGDVTLELAKQADDTFTLQVRDQGMGIPASDLPHIFETFYRAEGVEQIPGTGLGLSIVKDCVERHLGTIRVESEIGKGTTFTVTLPLGVPGRL